MPRLEGRVHDDALCDGDGGGSLGLRLCLCTSASERLAPPGAWHDVSAWHSQCAGRANRNSTRFDRNGRRRPQSSVRRSEPESLSARDELAAATQRHDAALDSVGGGGAEHTHMRGDPDRCPYDRGSADDVRSAFGRQSPGRGGDALPLINLEKRDVRLLPWAALSGTNPNHDRGARDQRPGRWSVEPPVRDRATTCLRNLAPQPDLPPFAARMGRRDRRDRDCSEHRWRPNLGQRRIPRPCATACVATLGNSIGLHQKSRDSTRCWPAPRMRAVCCNLTSTTETTAST